MAAPWDSALNLWGTAMSNNTETGRTQRSQKVLSQEAVDKLIYDALSSDQGLAALASGENLSGGFKSSSKTLLAQDMMTKLIGELASVTAETVTSGEEVKTTKEGRFLNKTADATGTVICTELNRQGYLSDELYNHPNAQDHFLKLPDRTVCGYQIWGTRVVSLMKNSPVLCWTLLPIAISRYEMTSGQKRFTILGALTIYIGQPVCYLIGTLMQIGAKNGRVHKSA